MAKEVWEKVTEAEIQAGKIIEDAKLQSVTKIKKAREEAVEFINAAESNALKEGEIALAESIKKAQAFKEGRIQELRNQQQSLNKTCEARMGGAVNLILEKVVR